MGKASLQWNDCISACSANPAGTDAVNFTGCTVVTDRTGAGNAKRRRLQWDHCSVLLTNFNLIRATTPRAPQLFKEIIISLGNTELLNYSYFLEQ